MREPSESARLIIELKTSPDFDPTEYTAISSSQLSNDTTHHPCEGESGNKPATDISQRTIPDSQAFSVSVFSYESSNATRLTGIHPDIRDHNGAPETLEFQTSKAAQFRDLPLERGVLPHLSSPNQIHTTQQEIPDSKTQSGSGSSGNIPSRQPDGFELQAANRSNLYINQESSRHNGQDGSQDLEKTLPKSAHPVSQEHRPGHGSPNFAGFLTQPEFILDYQAVQSSYTHESDTPRVLIDKSGTHQSLRSVEGSSHTASIRGVVAESSQQFAQIVPESKLDAESQTQTHWNHSEDSDCQQVIPETTWKRHRQALSPIYRPSRLGPLSEHIIESIEEVDSDFEYHSRPTAPAPQVSGATLRGTYKHHSPVPSSPQSADMENSAIAGTPTSMVERLRQIQAEALSRGKSEARADSIPPGDIQVQGSEADQSMPSPSAILPSVEPEHAPSLPHGQFQEETVSEQWPHPDLRPLADLNHSSVQTNGNASGTTELPPLPVNHFEQDLGINIDFPGSDLGLPGASIHEEPIPATIAPSVLSTNAEAELFPTTSLPIVSHPINQADIVEDAVVGILPMVSSQVSSQDSSPDTDQAPSFSEQILRETDIAASNEQIITLPLAANLRHIYLDILSDNEPVIESFTEVFAEDVYKVPDESLVTKVDDMLRHLYDLCDLPVSQEDLQLTTAEDMMKYARDTNSKFSFVYEFLGGMRDTDQQVLILARPGRVTEFLEALLSSRHFNYRRLDGLEMHQSNPDEPLRVILAPTNRTSSEMPADVGVVIAFDASARSSGLISTYQTKGVEDEGPLVLSLVVTHSIEHIDMRISRSMDSLERKNAIVVSVVHARDLISDPERGFREPHDVAEMFVHFMKEPTTEFYWEQQGIPDEVFEVYMSSQAQARATQRSPVPPDVHSDRSTSRKRQLVCANNANVHILLTRSQDDAGSGTGTPKRARVAESLRRSIEPRSQISDSLRHLLGNHIILNGGVAEVPIERLEALAAKVSIST